MDFFFIFFFGVSKTMILKIQKTMDFQNSKIHMIFLNGCQKPCN